MKIRGKVALVTGAARGIGAATVLELARGGCSVAVNFRSSKKEAEKTVNMAQKLGVDAFSIQADVGEDSECRYLLEAVEDRFGRLDVLVNNAGTTEFIPHNDLEGVTDETWDRILGINLKGPFMCVRAARALLEKSGNGEVVNVASIAGIGGTGSSIPYAASKAALMTLTVSLARVLGPRIRVNAVAPGFVNGEWAQEGMGDGFESFIEEKAKASPLQKVCVPEEVAGVIVSLITGPGVVTGQTVICDCGVMIGTDSSHSRIRRL